MVASEVIPPAKLMGVRTSPLTDTVAEEEDEKSTALVHACPLESFSTRLAVSEPAKLVPRRRWIAPEAEVAVPLAVMLARMGPESELMMLIMGAEIVLSPVLGPMPEGPTMLPMELLALMLPVTEPDACTRVAEPDVAVTPPATSPEVAFTRPMVPLFSVTEPETEVPSTYATLPK